MAKTLRMYMAINKAVAEVNKTSQKVGPKVITENRRLTPDEMLGIWNARAKKHE